MKDIFGLILKYIPAYLNEFFALAVAPKQFMVHRNRENIGHNLTNALAFLGITLCLVWLLQAPLIEKDAFFSNFSSAIVHMLIMVVVFSALLRLSWKIVGGKAAFKPFLITYCYFTGIVTFIIVIFKLARNGIIKANSPENYQILMANDTIRIKELDVYSDTYVIIGNSILLTGLIIAMIWLTVGWGAYRQLNELSKARSITACLVFNLISWPVLFFFFFIGTALT